MSSALVQADQQPEAAAEEGWADLLKPRYRWIMLLTTILPLAQQLSGINTCILYSSEVQLASESRPDIRHVRNGILYQAGLQLPPRQLDQATGLTAGSCGVWCL